MPKKCFFQFQLDDLYINRQNTSIIRGSSYSFYNIFYLIFLYFIFTTNLQPIIYYICLSYQSCSILFDQSLTDLFFYLAQSSIEFNKLYIGQLPLSITQPFIRDVLSKFTEVKDVRIIKGDARGTFDRFCYAFCMVRGTEEVCAQVIKKVNQLYPQWKLNVKQDNDRFKYMQNPNQSHQPNPRQSMQMGHHQQNQFHQQHNRGMGFQHKQRQQNFYQQRNYPQQNANYNIQHQQNYPVQHQQHQQFYPTNVNPQQHSHSYQQHMNANNNEPEKIVGQKHQRILVRQIWLGGIPQLCDKQYMHQLMSEFGIVQNLEIFPKFAFIKFKMVDQATIAFERAERIFMMFGNPPGFRIFFSDPSRRANIVGNHYQFDRQSPFIPVLFLGFPPVTSATIDLQNMKSICQKYGPIVNSYMRKNSNNQTRSYFLFTFDNLKSALKAKNELNKRRDLLGDKRVEVTLLLDQQIVLRGKDLSYTQRMFQADGMMGQKKKPIIQKQGFQQNRPQYQNYPPKEIPQIPNVPPQMQYQGMYQQQPPAMHYPGYIMPQQPQTTHNYPPTDMYYMPPQYFDPTKQVQNGRSSTDVHQLLQSVFDKASNQRQPERIPQNIQKKPIKTSSNNDQNISDIVSKMLGQEREFEHNQKDKQREVNWSGFLTWKGLKRVAVDGYTQQKQPQDYVINISNFIEPKDIIRKQKATMVLVPQSKLHQSLFKQYIKALKDKVGVSFTQHFLMYILCKSKQSDEIQPIQENQLLVIMEKLSLSSLIRDKLQKVEELK